MLAAIFYAVTKQMPVLKDSKLMSWIVVIVLSVLGVRFLDAKTVEAIMLPSGATAVAITTLLPIILFGYFIYKFVSIQTIRRIAWGFWTIAFFGLWIYRAPQLGEIAYIYLAGGILVLIVTIADGTFKKWFTSMRIGREQASVAYAEVTTLQLERNKFVAALADPNISKARIKAAQKRLKEIQDRLVILESM